MNFKIESLSQTHHIFNYKSNLEPENYWLVNRAMQAFCDHSIYTFVASVEKKVIGYYTISTGKVFSSREKTKHIDSIDIFTLSVDERNNAGTIRKRLFAHALKMAHSMSELNKAKVVLAYASTRDLWKFYTTYGMKQTSLKPLLYLPINALVAS